MAEQLNPTPQEDEQSPSAAEAWVLIDALLNEVITEAQRRRLEQLAVNDPAVARIYLRVMHLWSRLPLHLGARQQMPSNWQIEAAHELLDETMVMKAMKPEPSDSATVEGDIFLPAPATLAPTAKPGFWKKVSEFKRLIGIAAVLMLAVTATWLLWPAGDPAVVTAIAGTLRSSDPSLAPGHHLVAAKLIRLDQGAIEMRFRSGAVVTIAAPASFSLDPANAMTLQSGILAAHVPHNAIGFSVRSPGLKVVDQGTNFGIRTIDQDQGAEAAVFDGSVTTAAMDANGLARSEPVPLHAGSAIHILAGGNQTVRAAYAPDQYPRDVSKIRQPLGLFNTGSEVASDGADAHWQVVRVALQPDWSAQPAVLLNPGSEQAKLPIGRSVCPRGVIRPPPPGEYQFRTTVDFSGFESKSAVVIAHLFVTEAIVDIRINGSPAAGRAFLDAAAGHQPEQQVIQLPNNFWKPGANVIDFVVNYLPDSMPHYAYAGLNVTWDASASLLVKR